MYMYMHVCMYMYMYIHMHMDMDMDMHMYMYMYMYMHMYMHMYMWVSYQEYLLQFSSQWQYVKCKQSPILYCNILKWYYASILEFLSQNSVSFFQVFHLNTLRSRQDGRNFPDDILNWIFLNENDLISIEFLLKFVPRGPINNIPALVRRPGDKSLSEPMMVSLLTHICVTRPHRIK